MERQSNWSFQADKTLFLQPRKEKAKIVTMNELIWAKFRSEAKIDFCVSDRNMLLASLAESADVGDR